MADINTIFNQTSPSYQKPGDLDFPVSKIRLLIDTLWQAVTGKALSEDQRATLKQLIDLLNLLDEHKHESQKELIAAMLPSINPLLDKMPTLGVTGTHVFAHLVPMYQLYLPSVELMVKNAHAFSVEEALLYYELTIFDHLFLVHIFEQESNINMIELLLTIKAIILINALVYDYQQHVEGRSISFFTFLMRGGLTSDQLLPFLEELVEKVTTEAKQTVTNPACNETLEFLSAKLREATKPKAGEPESQENQQKEQQALDAVMQPGTPEDQVDQVFNQVTETPVEKTPSPEESATPVPVETPPIPAVSAPVLEPSASTAQSQIQPEAIATPPESSTLESQSVKPQPMVAPGVTSELELTPKTLPVATTPEPQSVAPSTPVPPPAVPAPAQPPLNPPYVGTVAATAAPAPEANPILAQPAAKPESSPLSESPSLTPPPNVVP